MIHGQQPGEQFPETAYESFAFFSFVLSFFLSFFPSSPAASAQLQREADDSACRPLFCPSRKVSIGTAARMFTGIRKDRYIDRYLGPVLSLMEDSFP
jgi:hypothetical protein